MNASIIYSSMTGHSKKIARAIAEKLDITAYNVKDQNIELKNMDVVFIVTGVYSGVIMPELEKVLNDIEVGQISKAAIIMSSVKQDYSKSVIKDILSQKGIEVAGEFSCYGSFLFMKFGHPNKLEISNAIEFAEDIYNKYK